MKDMQKVSETIQDPIFLVGCPRSGTTLLQQMLDAHPDVAIAPETFFIRNFWLQQEKYGDLAEDHHYHQLVEDIVSLPEFQEMALDPEVYRAAAWQSSRSYPVLLRLLLEQFAHKRGVTIVGEKTPNHLLYISILQQFFPNARFVHIVRDPRAVVASWQTVPWTTGTLAGDAAVWRRYMSTAREYPAALKPSLHSLHYEALIENPETTLKALCQFLQIQFEPAMLAFHLRPTHTVNAKREPWKINAKKQLCPTSLKRWQSTLSDSMIAEIEAVVWPEMMHFGYSPITNRVVLATTKASKIVQSKFQRAISRLKSPTLGLLR